MGTICKYDLFLIYMMGKISQAPSRKNDSTTLKDIFVGILTFANRHNDLIIPLFCFVSTEIRLTKVKLSNLKRLRAAFR